MLETYDPESLSHHFHMLTSTSSSSSSSSTHSSNNSFVDDFQLVAHTDQHQHASTLNQNAYGTNNCARRSISMPLFNLPLMVDHHSSLPPQMQVDKGGGGAALNRLMFQVLLMAPTSPAAKVNEETLTYLNQGQNYELRFSLPTLSSTTTLGRSQSVLAEANNSNDAKMFLSIVRLCFWDRKMQEAEQDEIKKVFHLIEITIFKDTY